jgi:hypothetical protein
VTWIWGPVASLNVASTLTPALTAFFAFVVLRRWVSWAPAAFAGGLLYGFSPFVLTSLEFAHLMTAALMLLPLILAALDEILVRQRHSPVRAGVALGLLVFAQFFLSSEVLALCAVLVFVCLVVLVTVGLIFDPDELRRLAPHAAKGLATGLLVGAVLLAWPVWFALDGPAHLSGLVWRGIPGVGGYVPSNFVSSGILKTGSGDSIFLALGGYEGSPLASSTYLGWGLIAVLAGGTAMFWRDRRLWLYGFLLLLCGCMSLAPHHGVWVPEQLFARVPVFENIIVQRYMAVGFLAAAVMLAIILSRTYELLPDWRGAGASLLVAVVALLPIAATFAPELPFAMQPVILPRWYANVAPNLPPGRVLLSYPAPFSGIQSSMSWQAVNRMYYSQAGGGGPQGQAFRAGSAEPGFRVLTDLGFGIGVPQPSGTAAEYAAVRHAIDVWGVNTVVVATNPTAPLLQQGHDPTYAAAFMTAALGRLPVLQRGAWVWYHVDLRAHRALDVPPGTVASCVAKAESPTGDIAANLRAPNCVGLHARRAAGTTPAAAPAAPAVPASHASG